MKARTGLFALAALLLLAAAPTEKQIEDDKAKMTGTYKIFILEINGKTIDADQIRTFEVKVARDTITIKANNNERVSTYRIDPTKDPKTIDLVWKGKTTLGIYSINGEKLKLCLGAEGSKKRPNDFETTKGSNWRYFNLLREKR